MYSLGLLCNVRLTFERINNKSLAVEYLSYVCTLLLIFTSGYYFTNLCCAIKFIQNLNGDSLRMPAEEFEAYTTGQLVPPINEANSKCHQVTYLPSVH